MSNVDANTPLHNTKNVVLDGGLMLCPGCGSTQLHHGNRTIHYDTSGDQGTTLIPFFCEECPHVPLLEIQTTHGSTFLTWR